MTSVEIKLKESEEKLRESEEKYRSLVETTSDWIWEVDTIGIYTYSNPKVKDILGFDANEIIGKTPFDLMPPDEAEKIFELFQKAMEMKEPIISLKNKNIHKDGHLVAVETNGVPFFDNNGDLMGYRGIDRDITQKVEAERKLKESEELYRSLTDGLSQTGIGIDIVDSNYKIIYQNQFLKEQFGEHKNRECFEFYLGLEKCCEDCPMMRAIQNKKVEKAIITAPNNRIYEIISAPLPNPDGTIERAAEVVIDITERMESEQKIKESEEKFSKAFRSSPNLMAITRMKDGCIVDVNNAFTKILGYKREELIGHTTLELDLWVDPQERDEFIKKLKDEKKVDSFDVKVYTKSGEILNTLYSGDVIYLNNEPHLITMASDISERRKAEQELKESEQKFKNSYDRANFYKDLFAHDMTNILQVINTSAEHIFFQLEDSEKSINIANIASIIKKQIERGTKLISNVRTLSELEEEENITKRVEIIKFINNAITFVKKAYERRNVKISFGDESKKHYTNANELLQDVFENVLINGIKYNDNSNIEISIKISKQEVNAKNYIKIEFIDNGMGVSDERKKVIFLRGNRELKGSKGMGLGLSLVSKILNIFNGEVLVENNIKGDYTKGSNFVILLPEVK